jgi:hypothetical protein
VPDVQGGEVVSTLVDAVVFVLTVGGIASGIVLLAWLCVGGDE